MIGESDEKKCPTFLYVGAGKGGSSWMYEIMREHPQVFVPEAKDIMFFDRYYDKGINWYLGLFSGATQEKAIGELSHDYFLSEQVACRIFEHFPCVKIIFCLREGVDRTFSEYLYDRTLLQFIGHREYTQGMTFEAFARIPDIVHRGDYYNNMKPFYDLFPRKNIAVFFYDDIEKTPELFARHLYEFLEVDTEFQPDSLHKRVNAARESRCAILANLAYIVGRKVRQLGHPNIVGGIKRLGWFEKLLYRTYKDEKEKPRISSDVIQRLRLTYHKDYNKLTELIGKPLPEDWFKI